MLRERSHASPLLRTLHWLPVQVLYPAQRVAGGAIVVGAPAGRAAVSTEAVGRLQSARPPLLHAVVRGRRGRTQLPAAHRVHCRGEVRRALGIVPRAAAAARRVAVCRRTGTVPVGTALLLRCLTVAAIYKTSYDTHTCLTALFSGLPG